MDQKKNDEKTNDAKILEKELFTPAMQKAVETAIQRKARAVDILSAAGNAYINMVSVLMGGTEHAAGIVQAQADYLKSLKDEK